MQVWTKCTETDMLYVRKLKIPQVLQLSIIYIYPVSLKLEIVAERDCKPIFEARICGTESKKEA